MRSGPAKFPGMELNGLFVSTARKLVPINSYNAGFAPVSKRQRNNEDQKKSFVVALAGGGIEAIC